MKRTLALVILPSLFLCGCGDTVRTYLGTATPTPVPTPAPVAKATPAKGDWMWKDYKNPLDAQKQKKK
jgi:hypothetical protein